MRFETPGLLHILKGLALVGAYGAFWFFFRIDWNVDELRYQLSRIDWAYATIFIVPILLLLGATAWRLLREYRIWKILYRPFRIINDPFIDVDLKEESYGAVILKNGNIIKRAATFASRSGIIVRKAAYPKMFPTFEISWDQISNIYFAALDSNEEFGPDPLGIARVTLDFAEEFILVLPWRRQFNKYIPDHIGLQNESLTA